MGKYQDKGFLLLRNQFFKSACFNTNLQDWFKDNDITSVSQLNGYGFTLAKKIEDIKLITTESSIKYTKFGSLENWLNNISSTFGIVKFDKPPKYFGGQYTRINYQMLNSLQFDVEKLKAFLQSTIVGFN